MVKGEKTLSACPNKCPLCEGYGYSDKDDLAELFKQHGFEELKRLAEIGRLTEKLLETGSMQHRFKYLDDIRSVGQLLEWGKDK